MLFVIILTRFVIVFCIMGGHDVSIQEVPYQVNYGDACGGVLIHPQWALTTAHCTENFSYIRIGSRYRLIGPKIKIQKHILHPKFGEEHKFDFDIQLLKFYHQLRFNKDVRAVELSDGDCGDTISVVGWGYLKEKGDFHETLQQVEMSLVPMQQCQEVDNRWYNNSLTDTMFCAGGWGADACQGDSGGPAVSLGKLVGLSSFGFGCGREMPGVYTNISHPGIRKWIKRYTGV